MTPAFVCDLETAEETRLRAAQIGCERPATQPDTNRANRAWEIEYRADASLTREEDLQLRALLVSCFSYNFFFWFRRYHLERPTHRWFIRDAAGKLIGHTALHEKVVGTVSGDLKIGGIAEVCVDAGSRGLGFSKALLRRIHDWMAAHDFPFSMLFGAPRHYASSGYMEITNPLNASNEIFRRCIPKRGKPMIKILGSTHWPDGPIDLRGPTF